MGFEGSGSSAGASEVVLPTTEVRPAAPPPAHFVSVARLLRLTFSTWRGAFLPLAALALLQNLAAKLLGLALGSPYSLLSDDNPLRPTAAAMAWNFSVGYWVHGGVSVCLFFVVSGAAATLAVRRLEGEPAALGTSLAAALRRAPTLLLGGLLVLLATYGGMMLLLVPGILWGLSFGQTLPVVMAEGMGARESMSRSRALARGFRWQLLGLYLVSAVAAGVPSWVGMGLWTVSPPAGNAVILLGNVLLGPIFLVAPAVAFHEIRATREGASALEKVFE